jgi:hypothetical protein
MRLRKRSAAAADSRNKSRIRGRTCPGLRILLGVGKHRDKRGARWPEAKELNLFVDAYLQGYRSAAISIGGWTDNGRWAVWPAEYIKEPTACGWVPSFYVQPGPYYLAFGFLLALSQVLNLSSYLAFAHTDQQLSGAFIHVDLPSP